MFNNFRKKIVSEKDTFKANDYYSKYKIEAYKYIKKHSKNNFFLQLLYCLIMTQSIEIRAF